MMMMVIVVEVQPESLNFNRLLQVNTEAETLMITKLAHAEYGMGRAGKMLRFSI